MRLTNKII